MAGLRVLLCLGALLARQGSADLGAVAIGEVHENVTLHCGNVSGSRGLVTWYRNDSEPTFLLSSNSSLPPASPRFSLEDAGALHVEALSLEDDGNYTCREDLNGTRWFPVWLRVASGPDQIEVNISATGTLSNGTLYTAKGSQVDFSCHSTSWPPPVVEWFIQANNWESLGKNLTANSFALLQMSQNLQGNYTCSATNVLSGRQRKGPLPQLLSAQWRCLQNQPPWNLPVIGMGATLIQPSCGLKNPEGQSWGIQSCKP